MADTSAWFQALPSILSIGENNRIRVLGRDKFEWLRVGFFYLAFFIVVGFLCSMCGLGLHYTLNYTEPKWKLEESLIGTNPGVGFRPMSEVQDHEDVIAVDLLNQRNVDKWVNKLDEFYNSYKVSYRNGVNCSWSMKPKKGEICYFDIDQLGPCGIRKYGYDVGKPCIILKINRIYGWMPQCHTNTSKDLPDVVNVAIEKTPKDHEYIWMNCRGETPADRELIGNVSYYPLPGFPAYYYPYVNTKHYLSPLMAVQFTGLVPDVTVNIECITYANNTKYIGGKVKRQGSVRFELMVIKK